MEKPNENVPIYDWKFELTHLPTNTNYKVLGKIEYTWLPERTIIFSSKSDPIQKYHQRDLELSIKDLWKGPVQLNRTPGLFIKIEGKIPDDFILKDKTNSCEIVLFNVPNLKSIGQETAFNIGGYEIKLLPRDNFAELFKTLKVNDYLTLFSGTLKKGGQLISFDEANDVLECFGDFLTLINGYRISAIFRQATINNDLMWHDFTHYPVTAHKKVLQEPLKSKTKPFYQLWVSFFKIYQDDKIFLKKLVNLYIDSISLSGSVEDSILKAQTGLELLFNWIIVEGKSQKVKQGFAADRIRMVLNETSFSAVIPTSYTKLLQFVTEYNKLVGPYKIIADGPGAIVAIRNPETHPDKVGREFAAKTNQKAKEEARDLAVSYLEQSILHIL